MKLGKGFKIFLYVLACLFTISTFANILYPYDERIERMFFWFAGGLCLLLLGITIFNDSADKSQVKGAKAIVTIFLSIAVLATIADIGRRYEEPTMWEDYGDDYAEEYLPIEDSYEEPYVTPDASTDYEQMGADTSFDGGMVDENVYSLSEIGDLCGFFTLNPTNQTVTGAAAPMFWRIHNPDYDDGTNVTNDQYIGATYYAPITIDRSIGEQLIVVGDMGNYVEDTLELSTAKILGYTNFATMVEVSLDEVEMLMGVDISNINNDVAQVNSAISNTPFTVAHYNCLTAHNDYIFDTASTFHGELYISDTYGADISYGYFDGTEYYESTVRVTDLTYMYNIYGDHFVNIQQTMNGYFIVDTSSLPAGYYVFYMLSDTYGGNNYYPLHIK